MKSMLRLALAAALFGMTVFTGLAQSENPPTLSEVPDFKSWLNQYNAQNPFFQLTLGPDGTLTHKTFSEAEFGALLPPGFLSELPSSAPEVTFPVYDAPNYIGFVPSAFHGIAIDDTPLRNPSGVFGRYTDDLSPSASVVPEPSTIVLITVSLACIILKQRKQPGHY
jgi:hypothetical protein